MTAKKSIDDNGAGQPIKATTTAKEKTKEPVKGSQIKTNKKAASSSVKATTKRLSNAQKPAPAKVAVKNQPQNKSSKSVPKKTPTKAKNPPKEAKKKAVAVVLEVDAKVGAGRPTKYKPEYCQMMLDFFDIEVMRCVEVEVKPNVKEVRYVPNTFPTITRFASNIGVTRDTLYEWASKKDEKGNLVNAEFSDTLTRCQDLQETLMVEGGLSGAYESKVLIFLAPNLTRLKNKVEVASEVNLSAATTEKLDALYNDSMNKIIEAGQLVAGRAQRLGLTGNK